MISSLSQVLFALLFVSGQSFVQGSVVAPEPLTQSDQDQVDPTLRAAVVEIQAEVEAIRGLKFKRPVALRVATDEDLRAYLKATLDEEATPRERAAFDTVAKLTGLLPADQDLMATQLELIESQVGGFYDPKTDTFSLMQSLVGSGLAKIILAHELTHALDDQHFDLDGGMRAREDNADALWAYHAVIEGSATAVMNKWTLQKMMSKEMSMEDLSEISDMGADVLKRMQPFLWKPLIGAYLKGSAFLARTDSVQKATMTMPSIEDLNRAFERPPLSSEQVLHPDAYWSADELDRPQAVDLALDVLPEGMELLARDTFGELQLGFLVEPLKQRKGLDGPMAVLFAKYTSPAVEGWGGDSWALLGQGQRRVLLLRTLWDSEENAQEFDTALGEPDLSAHFMGSLADLAKIRGVGEQVAYRHLLIDREVVVTWAIGFSSEEAGDLQTVLITR